MFSISPDIIILGFIAGFILFRLFTLLGKHDEDGKVVINEHERNKVIDITSTAKVEEMFVNAAEEANLAPGFTDVMDKIRVDLPSFSVKKFIAGAKTAFEMILTAFANNDRETLNSLLDSLTLKKFISEIDKRITNNHILNLTLVAINNLLIKNISYDNKIITIKVFIESQQINLIKNPEGNIIEGDPSQIDTVEDVWTFSKNLNSGEDWKLVSVNAS